MLSNLGNLRDGGRGAPLSRCSLHLLIFVQGDHLYEERDVGNIRVLVADDHRVESHVVVVDRQGEGERAVVAVPVRRMHPTGNLEGEVLVEHHRQLVDAATATCERGTWSRLWAMRRRYCAPASSAVVKVGSSERRVLLGRTIASVETLRRPRNRSEHR